MKIAIFTNNFLPRVSGVAVAVKFQAQSLKELGHKILIIAPEYGIKNQPEEFEVVRVKSIYFPSQRFAIPLNFLDQPAIENALEEFEPDLIHTHHPFLLGKSALEMADQFQVPLVYTFHTLYEFFTHYFLVDTEPVRKQVRDYVVNFANCCDLVITPTEPIRQYLIKNGVNTQTASVPTGIDFSRFDQVSPEKLERRKKQLGLEKFERVLLYVGRIAREKNLNLVFYALKILTEQGRNLALVIAGEGPAKKYYQRELEKLNLSQRVIWTGFLSQEELPEVYYSADLFVFPSPSDTQGIVLYEARASGLPIVALKSMASLAIVEDGVNGRFAENQPEDFAEKIAEVLDEPEKFQAEFDREKFSTSYIAHRYQELYQELVSQGRQRKSRYLGTIFFPFFNP